MLVSLRIENIALIDRLEVTFEEGLNVLTGETGAGKSVVIGAIGIALGGKFDKTLLRDDTKDGLVEVLFSLEPSVKKKLQEGEILPEDLLAEDELVITRKLTNNRVLNRINGETVPLARLRETAEILIDLHAQHEQTTLLKPAKHLEILDAGSEKVLAKKQEVRDLHRELQEQKRRLEELDIDPAERAKRMDFLRFQLGEIREAELRPGEDEELEQEFRRMSHAEELLGICQEVHQLTGDDRPDGCGGQLSRAAKRMQEMTRFEEDSQLPNQLSEVESLLADFNQSLSAYMEEITFEPEELRQITARLDLLNGLKAKYGRTLEDVQKTGDSLEEEIHELEQAEEEIGILRGALEETGQKLEKAASELTKLRKEAAGPLVGKVKETLKGMNFSHVEFYTEFSERDEIQADGRDEAVFMLSTNLGEEAKPLHKVASGGELSRVMLALKATLSDAADTPTLVFDEIDVGISGITAQKIGELLKKLAETRQLLVITHLPQIAAAGQAAYRIDKEVSQEKTHTTIRALDEEGRVQEIARLLGGDHITEAILQSARELLGNEAK